VEEEVRYAVVTEGENSDEVYEYVNSGEWQPFLKRFLVVSVCVASSHLSSSLFFTLHASIPLYTPSYFHLQFYSN